MTDYRHTTDVLSEFVDVSGKRVIDVGSGAGELVRWLREQGADSVGIECGEIMRQRALDADPDHPEAHVEGVGQDLPFDDESADLVIFSYSLHHVPETEMVDALAEAHRVLEPAGILFVVEPVPAGPGFQLGRLLDDETVVRRQAQDALTKAPALGFELVGEESSVTDRRYENFAAYEKKMVGIDPRRAEVMETQREEVAELFHELATRTETGYVFAQPQHFKVFAKR